MSNPSLRISDPRDLVKHVSGEMNLRWKELIAQTLLLCGETKKVLSRARVRSLEQRARDAHDQSEQTLKTFCFQTEIQIQKKRHDVKMCCKFLCCFIIKILV